MTTNFMVGADPELFLLATKSDDAVVSAHTYLCGTKEEPMGVDKGAVQVDGIAAEFNIDPTSDKTVFKTNIKTVLGQLRQIVPEECVFAFEPVARIPSDYFDTLPDENKLLGCSPDYNAYTEQMNPSPPHDDSGAYITRTAAGHIHIGWCTNVDPYDKKHFSNCIKAVRGLDAVLYPVSLTFGDIMGIKEREKLYGARGAFRPKPYGVEYRSLANHWVKYEESIDWVFEATNRVLNILQSKEHDVEKIMKQTRLFRTVGEEEIYFLNKQLEEMGVPPVPPKLTELAYG